MRKSRKRSVGIFLAAALVISVFTGCLTGCAKTNENTQSDSNFNAEGLPIVKEPITIKVVSMRWGTMGDTFKDNTWLKNLEKDTNIKVEWQIQSSSDWDEQKPLLLASGSLPDVFLGDQTLRSTDIVNNLGYFRPLDDLIDKYMPNLKAAMENYPTLRKMSTFTDGKIYSMPARLPSRPYSCNQLIINKTWLDKLNLKVPTTIDELEQVLLAFKNNDPNGNGKQDEIGFTCSTVTASSLGITPDFMAPFGISDLNSTFMLIDNNEPVFWPTSDNYKEAIKWVRKLYSEGLIDPECFTQDDQKLSGKNQNADAPLVGMSYQWTPDSVFGKWSDQYIAIEPVTGPDGKKYQGGDPESMSYRRNELEITTSCKYPEAVARWADQWYTGEASIQNYWGALGTVTEKNSDGTYSLLKPPAGKSADDWYWSSSLRDFGPKFVSEDFNKLITLPTDSGDGLKLEIDKLGKDCLIVPFPDCMYTNEEASEIATLNTDISSFVKQTQAQWITKGGVDEGWDEYVSKLDSMGLSRYVKIRTDAYNRYNQ